MQGSRRASRIIEPTQRSFVMILLAVLLCGAALRLTHVGHPYDEHTLSPWREADYTQVARSFYREGMDIRFPRIDWRGTTTGHVEMEMPILPWTAALLYHICGYHEQILRVLSALASIAALLAFARLAWGLLPPGAAVAATAVWAVNPLLVLLAGAMQPESLMILLTVMAVLAIERWLRTESRTAFLLACGLTAVAILAKSPAATLGLVLAYFTCKKKGYRAVIDPVTLLGAALALLPPLCWYLWARGLYHQTGLSLGVSNETHFITWELLRHPLAAIQGNVTAEWHYVLTPPGLVLLLLALVRRGPQLELPLVWYGAVASFYLATANTSGDSWAFYYHASSLGPAALLVGAGLSALTGPSGHKPRTGKMAHAVALVMALLVVAAHAHKTRQGLHKRADQPALAEMRGSLPLLRAHVPEDALIVVRGGRPTDALGQPVAYNASMAFVWMDRKGFQYPVGALSAERLAALHQQGARYWVAARAEFEHAERWAAAGRISLVARAGGFAVYDLVPRETASPRL